MKLNIYVYGTGTCLLLKPGLGSSFLFDASMYWFTFNVGDFWDFIKEIISRNVIIIFLLMLYVDEVSCWEGNGSIVT